MAIELRLSIQELRKSVAVLHGPVKPLREATKTLRTSGTVVQGLVFTTVLTPTTEMSDFN